MMAIASFTLMILSGCSSDHSGDYKLVDVEVDMPDLSEKQYNKELGRALGSIYTLEKIGDRYIMSTDDDPDKLVFNPDGSNFSAQGGKMVLKFSGNRAILTAVDGAKSAKWTLEKE